MNDLVSIVVPVYNVQQYLPRCLESLTAQTYRNIEIILVDDGSTDASGELCDHWAAADPRVRAFHKKNGGLSDARNYGLQKAAGAYVCFVDSDDWCDVRYIELMLRTLLETDSDIVECDFQRTKGQPVADSSDGPHPYELYCGRDCFLRFLEVTFSTIACNKIFRRALIENEPFRVGVLHEDEFWTYRIFAKANRVCRLRYTGYFYFQRSDSISNAPPSHKRLNDAFLAGKERVAFIEQHYPEFASIGYSKMMYTCIFLYNIAGRSHFPGVDAFQQELFSYFRIIFRKYLLRGRFRNEIWRFCFFRFAPKHYCKRSF